MTPPIQNNLLIENINIRKWYPLSKRADDRIQVDLTPIGANKNRIIYVFRNKSTGELYIGKTSQLVKKRVSQHVHAFNNPHRDIGKLPLPKAVREHPERFEFSILYEAKIYEDLSWWERAFIIANESSKFGYNSTAGGEGGEGRKPLAERDVNLVPPPSPGLAGRFPSKYYYFNQKKDGSISLLLTPSVKDKKPRIYLCIDDKGEGYVGKTEQAFSKRMAQHLYNANHPERDSGQGDLYDSIRQKRVKVGVLEEVSPEHEAGAREARHIEELSQKIPLKNKTSGSNGSSVARKLMFNGIN
jgi:predicted GIY-YIG superfamily endonuclease